MLIVLFPKFILQITTGIRTFSTMNSFFESSRLIPIVILDLSTDKFFTGNMFI